MSARPRSRLGHREHLGDLVRTVTVSELDSVTVIRLDRGPVNAIDLGTLDALVAAIGQGVTRGVPLVLTGRDGAFSAGIDVKEAFGYSAEQRAAMVTGVNRLCHVAYGAAVPVVAAVSGHAIGGGLVLVLCCDHRVGSTRSSVYALPEARAGVPFPAGAMAVVRAELSPATARRLALGDLRYNPDQALAAGILDELASPDDLLDRAVEAARRLAQLPSDTFRLVKHQLRAATLADLAASVSEGPDPLVQGWLGA